MTGSHRSLFFIIPALVFMMTGPALVATAEPLLIATIENKGPEGDKVTGVFPSPSLTRSNNAAQTAPTGLKQAPIANQRKTFLAADKALEYGQLKRYRRLKAKLTDYPLLPYLEYSYLRKRLHRLPNAQIEEFLQKYDDSPLQQRLRGAWLSRLAKKGQWQQYLTTYPADDSGSTRQQCLNRWALYKTGQKEKAYKNLEKLWLVGRSQPRSCDRIFAAWQTDGNISTEQVWQRFQLAIKARKISLARHLVKLLPSEQKRWAKLWLRVHRQPQLITNAQRFASYHPLRNTILVHGLRRLAYRNLDKAVSSWAIIQNRYTFNQAQHNEVERSLALRHALKGHPDALSWMSSLSNVDSDDPLVGEWRIRAALDQQNWDAVLNGIHLLNEDKQNSLRWRYWRARALEALDQQTPAYNQYWELAQSRSYYGFLAADRLGVSYRFEDQPVIINNDEIKQLEQLPGLARARELFALGRTLDARREWLYSTRNLSESMLQQAAAIAHQWGWHDRAILTMARTRHRDDLALRFPLAYRDKVSHAANNKQIDPALAFALIRQESAFIADIRSHAGAMGLMQLMPATAREVARYEGVRLRGRLALTDAKLNLKLGMSHLRRVLNRTQNNPVLATAAYNAGEHRVKQWLPKQGSMPADIWTEIIPFTETRNYVQNIMLFMSIYEQQLGLPRTTLQQRMPAISSPRALLAANLASLNPS